MSNDDRQNALDYHQSIVRIFKVTIHYIYETHARIFEPLSGTYNVEAYNDRDAVEAARLHMINVVDVESILFYDAVLICEVDVTSGEIVHE